MKNEPETLTINDLKEFVHYILDDKLDEFCRIQMAKFEEIGHGLFPEYDSLPFESKLELSKQVQSEFLKSIKDSRYEAQIDADLKKYEQDLRLSNFSDYNLDARSLEIILEARTYSLHSMLEELAVGQVVQYKIENEINELNQLFNKKMIGFLASTKDQAFKLYRNKVDEMHKAIRYAQTIQSNMMRIENEIEHSGVNAFVLNMPRDLVSGDFYHFQRVENGIFLTVSDCTGHGIPAALLTVLGLNLFQIAIQYRRSDDPSEILGLIDIQFKQQFQYSLDSKESMDVALVFIPNEGNTVKYASANAAVFLQTKDETTKLRCDRRSLGSSISDFNYQTFEFTYDKGDRLFLQSDGFQDQFGGVKGKSLKRRGYVELLERMRSSPMIEIKTKMDQFMSEWMANEEQIDDICVMGIEF